MSHRPLPRSALPAIWDLARCFAALVLLAAAPWKLSPASPPLEFQGIPVATGLVIVVEVLVGAWLLSGRFPRSARAAALVLFAAFAVVSLAHAVGGAASCGCLGPAAVPPALMMTIDTVALCLLVAARPAVSRRGSFPARAVGGLAGAAVILLVLYSAGPADALDDQPVMPQLGEAWPVADAKRSPVDLSRGLWYVVVYRTRCNHCREFLSEIANSDIQTSYRVAFAEIQASAANRTGQLGVDGFAMLRTAPVYAFRESRDVATPTIVVVRDGTVVAAHVPAPSATAGQVFAALAAGSL